MNNILSLLFSKTKFYLILFFCTLCMMETCETNTDANLVLPTARLQIYGKDNSDVNIDISSDGKTKPSVPAVTQVNPDDIVIRATGIQPDKNIGHVIVNLRYYNTKCTEYSGGNSSNTNPTREPARSIQLTADAPSGGIGILASELYHLKDYAKLFKCDAGTVEVDMDVVVTVYNIAGKTTELPPVKLKMKYSASDYQ